MIESSPAIKPEGSLTGDTASMHSFAWAGGAGSSKQREGLGVGDLREALSAQFPCPDTGCAMLPTNDVCDFLIAGRSSLSTTHLAPSMSSIHSPSVRGAGSIKTGGGRSRTLRNKPDDVADLFRRLGIGKEGRKGKNVASSRSVSGNGVTSRHPTGANGEGRILKAEDLELGCVSLSRRLRPSCLLTPFYFDLGSTQARHQDPKLMQREGLGVVTEGERESGSGISCLITSTCRSLVRLRP